MLPELPPVVMDNILEQLENQDLVALCRTCKTFYASAMKSLYSQQWPQKARRQLELSLGFKPENTKYVREYHCTNIQQLSQLLSKYPMRLERLKMYFNERQPLILTINKFDEDCTKLVSSIHPETLIEEIDCSELNPVLFCNESYSVNGRFIEKIGAFRGLESLIVKAWEFGQQCRGDTFQSIQPVIDQLASLPLKRITFIDADFSPSEWRVNLGEKLPSLQAVQFHYAFPSGVPEITVAQLRILEAYKERGVFFQVTASSYSEQYMQFYYTALKLPDEEQKSFIEWLVLGEQYFQTEVGKKDRFLLDLRSSNYNSRDRDKILKFVQKLPLKDNFSLQVNLYSRDSDIFYFPDPSKEAEFFKNFLHKQISYLEVCVKQSIHTKFIPSLIQSLKNLSQITVTVQARKPALSDNDYDDYGEMNDCCQQNRCEHILDPGPWCTRAIYSVALGCNEFDCSVCFNLELKVNQKPRWTIHEYEGDEQTVRVDQKSLKGLENRNTDIQKELTGWFKLNRGLRSINFRVYAGEPWY